jgi:cellobiose-specific phosphotransferase system component IIC
MDKTQIIIISVAMAILAIRIYQKYIKKSNGKSETESVPSSVSGFSTSNKDDDYEPYSKK